MVCYQFGERAPPAVQAVVNETGLMSCFLGMERRAMKCLWTRLKWRDGALIRASDGCGTLACKTLLAHWRDGKGTINEGKPTHVQELDYDEEFRHLGYTASLWGISDIAMTALRAVAHRMALGFLSRPSLSGASHRVAKLYHSRLPTEARLGLWAGRESGELICGCGHRPSWTSREQIDQLQWHMFSCSLPEETSVRCRWLKATRRDIVAHIRDATIARVIVRCWSHTNDGRLAVAEQDQRQQWRAPSMHWRNGAWRFVDVVARTHDASGFDSDDDEGEARRAVDTTATITKRDQYGVD